MIRLYALLILWSLPWQGRYWLDVGALPIYTECADHQDSVGPVGYYDDEARAIELCPHPLLWPELRHAVIHEAQHHMQLSAALAGHPVRYEAFNRAVLNELDHGRYTEDTRAVVRGLIAADATGRATVYSELHAELPWLLGMDVPPSLRSWYPWFDLGGAD